MLNATVSGCNILSKKSVARLCSSSTDCLAHELLNCGQSKNTAIITVLQAGWAGLDRAVLDCMYLL